MALDREADSSVLAENIHAVAAVEPHCRARIVVKVENVTASAEVSAGSRVYKPCRILGLGECRCILCAELSPGLIERNPYHDTWE